MCHRSSLPSLLRRCAYSWLIRSVTKGVANRMTSTPQLVYAAASDGVVKIGISVNPLRRMAHVGLELDKKFAVVKTWAHTLPRKIELTVRWKLKLHRVWGEEYFGCSVETLVFAVEQSIIEVNAGAGACSQTERRVRSMARADAVRVERMARFARISAEYDAMMRDDGKSTDQMAQHFKVARQTIYTTLAKAEPKRRR